MRRRKAIYENIHPETKADQNASKERKTSDKLAFVSDIAAKTGKSKQRGPAQRTPPDRRGSDSDNLEAAFLPPFVTAAPSMRI